VIYPIDRKVKYRIGTMKLRLHEIELNSKNPEACKRFYADLLGIPVNVDQKGLRCFDSGRPGLDIDTSVQFPGKVSISFLVEHIDQLVEELGEKGLHVDEPTDSHLGMRTTALEDPDGNRVKIQPPIRRSPNWLRKMIE
jgi:catechol 2,3-dioxygenase-like lactoylglutathione lyase family enzyme